MDHLRFVIAGAGIIGRSTALLARYFWPDATIVVGDQDEERARRVAQEVEGKAFRLAPSGLDSLLREHLRHATVLIDCLPGKEAFRMAQAALETQTHYINLTEHVHATRRITEMVKEAGNVPVGVVLQAGLAPGFVNVLTVYLAQKFERLYGRHPSEVRMRVGALSPHVQPPHFYARTWSGIGVAVEYVKPSVVIREGKRVELPSLSERETLILRGMVLEADLTSGGAASTPEFFEGKVQHLDYKTLRWPGHYTWVQTFLDGLSDLPEEEKIHQLHRYLVEHVPIVEDDWVLVYVSVSGQDATGAYRMIDRFVDVTPGVWGGHRLTAIQATTTAAALQAIDLLLTQELQGIIFQTDLPPDAYLGGRMVREIYGEIL